MSLHLYQLRVVEERTELVARIVDLKAFLKTAACIELPRQERIELHEQLHWMNGYEATLSRRIHAFPAAPVRQQNLF